MRKILQLSCVLALAGLSLGCATKHVVVAPADVAMVGCQTREGCVNTAGLELGNLVALDPETGRAYVAMSVPVGAYDLCVPAAEADHGEPFAAPFDLAYTDSAPPAVKSKARAKVRECTTLHVESASRFALRAPAMFAMAHDEMARKMSEIKSASPQTTFFLVSQMTGAKRVYLTCDAPKKTVKVGKYQFHVYLERENLELAGMFPRSQFYSLTPLTLGRDSDGRAMAMASKELPRNLDAFKFSPEAFASAE